ncbi:MAG: DUF2207 domain-containing protein, partial [Acidobacteria bacterium]|nr:DUF2207 domain-containing protein [Acidobacteriota bacterium]
MKLRNVLSGWISLLLLLLLAPTVYAQRSWRISDFTTEVDVHKDGSADVDERISLVFIGTFHGIHRYIPVDYPGPDGSNYSLFLKVTGVLDESGEKLKYDSKKQGPNRVLTIYIPGATDTSKRIHIRYSVRDAIKVFEDHDEFYWNVTGNGWPVAIDAASATVHFPADAAGKLRAQAFVGIYGSHEKAPADLLATTVNAQTANPLSAHEGLSVDVFIPKGVLEEPGGLTRLLWFIRSNPIVLLPIFAFAVMFPLWWTKGRDPKAGISVAPMYAPPKDMSPAEVGTLIDDSTDPRDITSILVDMAVRGYIKIREEQVSQMLVFKKKDYVFVRLKDRATWSDLAPFEQEMMNGLFPGDESETHIADLRNRFYLSIGPIKQYVMSALKQKGMYSLDPESAHGYWILGAIVTAIPFVLASYFLHIDLSQSGIWLAGSIVLAVLIIFLFSRIMTAKSLKGVRTRVEIVGFQEFMNRVDADRLKRMPPDTFEKYLPYAMALGVEHRWAKAFQGIVQNAPTWYEGAGYGPNFNTWMFMHDLSAMTTDTTSAFVSTPRASYDTSG